MPQLVICPIRLTEVSSGKFAWAPKVRLYSADWAIHSEWNLQAGAPADPWCVCRVDSWNPAMNADAECVKMPADPDELLGITRAATINAQLTLIGVENPDAVANDTSHDLCTRLGRRRGAIKFSTKFL